MPIICPHHHIWQIIPLIFPDWLNPYSDPLNAYFFLRGRLSSFGGYWASASWTLAFGLRVVWLFLCFIFFGFGASFEGVRFSIIREAFSDSVLRWIDWRFVIFCGIRQIVLRRWCIGSFLEFIGHCYFSLVISRLLSNSFIVLFYPSKNFLSGPYTHFTSVWISLLLCSMTRLYALNWAAPVFWFFSWVLGC